MQPALTKLLLPFQAGSSDATAAAAVAAAGSVPREGDLLDLDLDAAVHATLPRKAAATTVHMRLMLGREAAAAALAAIAAAAAAATGCGSDASGLGFGKLTSQLALPDADVDAALRRRLPDVTGFNSCSPAHTGGLRSITVLLKQFL